MGYPGNSVASYVYRYPKATKVLCGSQNAKNMHRVALLGGLDADVDAKTGRFQNALPIIYTLQQYSAANECARENGKILAIVSPHVLKIA